MLRPNVVQVNKLDVKTLDPHPSAVNFREGELTITKCDDRCPEDDLQPTHCPTHMVVHSEHCCCWTWSGFKEKTERSQSSGRGVRVC